MTYELIDSGHQMRLERFGNYVLSRPCSTALWSPRLSPQVWNDADATFTREQSNRWIFKNKIPSSWEVEIEKLRFKVAMTDFGHLGIFPEHQLLWKKASELVEKQKSAPRILNLFAYSGAATLALSRAGAEVCHVDASHPMVALARENAKLNHLQERPIRWIVDDVFKFLAREKKRGSLYDGVLLDPPTFGRGTQKEVFKIEEHIIPLLKSCRDVLTPTPLMLIFSSHTPGMTPTVMHHLLTEVMSGHQGVISASELLLFSKHSFTLPLGSFAYWVRNDVS